MITERLNYQECFLDRNDTSFPQKESFLTSDVLLSSQEIAGYDPYGDAIKFKKDVENLVSQGFSFKESMETAALDPVLNIKGYWAEYVKRISVLPIPNTFLYTSEGRRVIAHPATNLSPIDITGDEERGGALKSVVEETVNLLEHAPKGSIVLYTSPKGDPGWTFNGVKVKYEETQTSIYKVTMDGELDAFTIVTDMGIEEILKFYKKLGSEKIFSPDITETELEAEVTSTVIYLKNTGKPHNYAEVIKAMQDTMGGEIARSVKESDPKEKRPTTFSDLLRQITAIENPPHMISRRLDQLYRWILININNLDDPTLIVLEKEIKRAVLDVVAYSKYLEGDTSLIKNGKVDYEKTAQVTQSLGGCAGSGEFRGTKKGRRFIIGGRKKIIHCGKCGVLINDYIGTGYICRSCGGVYRGC